MKLNYRGVSYEHNQLALDTITEKTTGKYRGKFWQNRNLKANVAMRSSANKTYRGVAY